MRYIISGVAIGGAEGALVTWPIGPYCPYIRNLQHYMHAISRYNDLPC